MPVSPLNRRAFVKRSAVTGAAVAVAGAAGAPAAQAAEHQPVKKNRTWSFSVLGTTDLHSHVFDWDYYLDKAYSDSKGNSVGVARVATLIKQQRAAKGEEHVLLVDAGDIIQGTSLAYYFARVQPITAKGAPKHPMAVAMNHMRYDAAALGNHEFNYGIEVLRKFESQCRFPLLGANALDAKTLKPAFQPYTVKRICVPGAPDIKVGILGLTNPGIALWDKDNVSGKMVFPGLVEQAKKYVPRLRALGCDVVFLTDHSGLDGSSSYGDEPRTSRTPRTSSPSRSPASTRSSSATPTSRCRRTRSRTRRPVRTSSSPSRTAGATGSASSTSSWNSCAGSGR